jgi:hypothetical protein
MRKGDRMKAKLSRPPNLDKVIYRMPFVFIAFFGVKDGVFQTDHIPLQYPDGKNYLGIEEFIINEKRGKR